MTNVTKKIITKKAVFKILFGVKKHQTRNEKN